MINPNIALQVRPIEAPDPLASYGQALKLRDLLDSQKMRAQQMQLDQQLGAQQIKLNDARIADEDRKRQTEERALQDQEVTRQILGEMGGDIERALPRLASKIAPSTFQAIQKAHLESKRTLSQIANEELPGLKYQNEQLSLLTQQAQQLPDDEYVAKWPLIRQTAAQINPKLQIPDQPIPKEQLAILSLGFQTEKGYLEREEARRKAKLDALDITAKTQKVEGTEPIQPVEKANLEAQTAYRQAQLAMQKRGQDISAATANRTAARLTLSANAGNEARLRDDFRADSRNYSTVRDAYGRIVEAARTPSGPGDISLLYGYMRILDPGSTVREGEFATAQNAGSIPDNISAAYNRALKGERLTPQTRNQFIHEANKVYGRATADHDKMKSWYRDTARRSGMNPDNVLVDYSTSLGSSGAKDLSGLSTEELLKQLMGGK